MDRFLKMTPTTIRVIAITGFVTTFLIMVDRFSGVRLMDKFVGAEAMRNESTRLYAVSFNIILVLIVALIGGRLLAMSGRLATENDKRRQELISSLSKSLKGSISIGDIEIPKLYDRDDPAIPPPSDPTRFIKPPEFPPVEPSFYDKVTEITFEYIESYYRQTQTQASRSFALSAVASALSFFIIAYGVTMLYQGKSDASKVTVAVGAFSQFISAVFFYLYNRTVLKMSEYHQKLVMTQNVMMAIKLTEDLPANRKADARIELIGTLTKDINYYLSPNPEAAPLPSKSVVKRKRAAKPAKTSSP